MRYDKQNKAWEATADALERYVKSTLTRPDGGAVAPRTEYGYDNKSGLMQVPYTSTEWFNVTRMETDGKCGLQWLMRGRHYRDADGNHQYRKLNIHSEEDGTETLEWDIVWSMVRNVLVTTKITGVRFCDSAVSTSVSGYLSKYTACPKELLTRLKQTIARIAAFHIDLYADYGLAELNKSISSEMAKKMVFSKECRNKLKKYLKSRGILKMRTFSEQEALIDRAIAEKFPELSRAKPAIINWLKSKKALRPRRYEKLKMHVSEVLQKKRDGIRLTAADRKLLCSTRKTHPELLDYT